MDEKNSDTLRIGRLEDKISFYEPILVSLQKLSSVPEIINDIHKDLQALREARVETKGKLSILIQDQDKIYRDTLKILEDRSNLLKKEIDKCPIKEVASKVYSIEKDLAVLGLLDSRMSAAESLMDSFRARGWDLLLKILPWAIAGLSSSWILFQKVGGLR